MGVGKAVKRAFSGLAGSPLARVKKQKASGGSDHTLRAPHSDSRKDLTLFSEWWDGQRFDYKPPSCEFQSVAFDPHLGGASPNVDSERSGRDRSGERENPVQDLGLSLGDNGGRSRKKMPAQTGLLPGARQIRRRNPTNRSWWVFKPQFLREFVRNKFETSGQDEAMKVAKLLYAYYLLGQDDETILGDIRDHCVAREIAPWFRDVKALTSARQYLVLAGAELFKDQRPQHIAPWRSSTWERDHWRHWRSIREGDPIKVTAEESVG